jgi:hypothetical protein
MAKAKVKKKAKKVAKVEVRGLKALAYKKPKQTRRSKAGPKKPRKKPLRGQGRA